MRQHKTIGVAGRTAGQGNGEADEMMEGKARVGRGYGKGRKRVDGKYQDKVEGWNEWYVRRAGREEGRTRQGRTWQGRAGKGIGLSRTGWGRAGQGRAGQGMGLGGIG